MYHITRKVDIDFNLTEQAFAVSIEREVYTMMNRIAIFFNESFDENCDERFGLDLIFNMI